MKVYMPGREWPEPYKGVIEELKCITDPITGGDILDSGVVAGLEVADDTLKVWLNFESHAEYNMTGASAIAYSKIIGDIIERFALVKFQNIYIYDLKNNPIGVFENRGGYNAEDISRENV